MQQKKGFNYLQDSQGDLLQNLDFCCQKKTCLKKEQVTQKILQYKMFALKYLQALQCVGFVCLILINFDISYCAMLPMVPSPSTNVNNKIGAHQSRITANSGNLIPGIYTVTVPFGRTYNNAGVVRACMNSFVSTMGPYFGIDVGLNYSGSTLTSVDVVLTVLQNSTFSLIGVSILVISAPFDSLVIKNQEHVFTIAGQTHNLITPTPAPALADAYIFVNKVKGQATSTRMRLELLFSAFSTTSVSIQLASHVRMAPYSFSISVFYLLFDRSMRNTQHYTSLVDWNRYYCNDTAFITSTTFDVDASRYGTDFGKHCLVGFPNILQYPGGSGGGIVDWDFDPVVGIQINYYVVYAGNWRMQSLCFFQMVCPSTHPYQKANNYSCFNCDNGVVVNNVSAITVDPLCQLDDNAYKYSTAYVLLEVCYLCIQCEDHYYAENATCHLCNLYFPNCNTCNQKIACLTCDVNYLVQAGNCTACSVYFPNCVACSTNVSCTTCNTGFIWNGVVCQPCSVYFPNCLTCSSNISCTTCNNGFGWDGVSLVCMACSTGCLLCPIYTICDLCMLGYTKSGDICLPCSSSIPNCLTCSSTSICLTCDPGFQVNANHICQFDSPGCLFPVSINSITICLACNASLGLVYNVTTKGCSCDVGLKISNNPLGCNSQCGDGFTVFPEQCDDNNIKDGDGCSSTCIQELNYVCSSTSPSKCVIVMNFKIFDFISIERVPGENKAIVTFSIEPSFLGLQNVDWPKLIALKSGTTVIPSALIQTTYQYYDSRIKFQFPYFSSLEDQLINFDLKFTPDTIISDPDEHNVSFIAEGITEPIIFEDQTLIELFKVTSTISLIVMVLILIQFFVASYFNKMIGLETIQIVQFIYFARILMKKHSASFINGFDELKNTAFGGYSDPQVLFGLDLNPATQSMLDGNKYFISIGLYKYFSLNVNISLIPLGLALMVYGYSLLKKYKTRSDYIQTRVLDTKDRYTMLRRQSQRVYDNYVFPYLMLFNFVLLYNSLYYLQRNQQSSSSSKNTIISQMQTISEISFSFHVFMLLLNLSVFSYEIFESFSEFKRHNQSEKEEWQKLASVIQKLEHDENDLFFKRNFHPLYCLVYLIYYLLINVVVIIQLNLNKQFKYGLEVVTSLTIFYSILIFLWKPYREETNAHNQFLKVNHFTTSLFLLICVCLERFNVSNTALIILAMTIMTSLLVFVVFGGYVRILVQFRFNRLVDDNIIQGDKKISGSNKETDNMKEYLEKNSNNKFLFRNQVNQYFQRLKYDPDQIFLKFQEIQQSKKISQIKNKLNLKNNVMDDEIQRNLINLMKAEYDITLKLKLKLNKEKNKSQKYKKMSIQRFEPYDKIKIQYQQNFLSKRRIDAERIFQEQ